MDAAAAPFLNQETLQQRLQTLIEGARESWSYAIFWQSSAGIHPVPSVLGWGDGYYEGEEDKGNRMNSSSAISLVEQEYRKKVLLELNSLIPDQDPLSHDAVDEEVTDTEWFFLISMVESFAIGRGLPGRTWQNSIPLWITGKESLLSSNCDRACKAFVYGLQTLVFIPSENGVIELGSMALNLQRLDLLKEAVPVLNFIHSWGLNRPVEGGDESESSNSIRNSAIVRSNPDLKDQELSLGLHLGLKAWQVKPQYDTESSSSSVGNYRFPVVKEKPVFSGKLGSNSENDSDNSDINAFVRILRCRRK